MKYTLTSPPVPGASILHCGICGIEVHRTLQDDLRFPEVIADEAEKQVRLHLLHHHPIRFWLWGHLRWKWLLGGIL